MIKRLVNCVISDTVCNLDCAYCYVGQMQQHVRQSTRNPHSTEEIVRALSMRRLGGCCHMNICASGETLLVEGIVDLAEAFIREGHVVSIVTNGLASGQIHELCGLAEDVRRRLFLKISFHYLEMKKRGCLERFWENVGAVKAAGISFTVELTVNDASVPHIPEIREACRRHLGADCHVIESRRQDGRDWPRLTEMPVEEHQRAWGQFESPLFQFQQSIWGERRSEFCYAGDWVCSVDLKTGDVTPCFGGGKKLDNIYEDVESPIRFCAFGHQCPWGHCYAAYVLLAHGAIPELDAAVYAEERDRLCSDGTSWLQPEIRRAFSERLELENEPYSEKRRALTDFVMGQLYGNYSGMGPERLSRYVRPFFADRGVRRAAVYGAGRLGLALYELLRACGVEVACFMDRRYERLETPAVCVSGGARLTDVDLIIVTAYSEYRSIVHMLRESGNEARIISVLDLLEQ